jgi:general bacterial porin, GBP family
MQRKNFAVAMTLGALAGSAHAQSSVTLYGIIDPGFQFISNQNGNKAYQVISGNESGSRWGVTGTEDLGGGLKGTFKLENGFNVYNGSLAQGGLEFGRQAWVGLGSSRFGTVTLGRQYNAVSDFLTYDLMAGVGALTQFGLAVYDNNDLNNTYRTNNAVKYVSPTVAGLTAEALYGFSNTAGQFSNNRTWSVGADYANGPLRVDVAYALLNHPAANTSGAITSYYTTSSSIISNVERSEVVGAGASYTIGAATATFLYTHSNFRLIAGGGLNFANYDAGVRYFVRPDVVVSVAYTYTNQQSSAASAGNAHYNQLLIGGQYYLSKTTDLYANIGQQRASGTNAWIQGSSAPSSNRIQSVALFGVRHKF